MRTPPLAARARALTAAPLLVALAIGVLAGPLPAVAPPAGTSVARDPKFVLPEWERLTFSIEFGVIKAGSATLEIKPLPRGAGDKTIEISSRARSSAFFSKFYPVDDVVRCIADRETLLPIRFEKRLSEGDYRANEVIVFDRDKNLVRYSNGDTLSVPPLSRDALSALHDVRRHRMQPGESFVFINHSGKKTMGVEVKVIKRETIETRVGRFRCLKTEPTLMSGGLFKNEGRLWVWYTDDARKIPIRMETQLTFGSIVAEIERIERPDFTSTARRSERRS
jgi:hypothetical protein